MARTRRKPKDSLLHLEGMAAYNARVCTLIERALRRTKGNVSEAARSLGITSAGNLRIQARRAGIADLGALADKYRQ